MSGRARFALEKCLEGDSLASLWRNLPNESKNYWNQLGRNASVSENLSNAGNQKKINSLSFMNRII
jgi:hypothetical protein